MVFPLQNATKALNKALQESKIAFSEAEKLAKLPKPKQNSVLNADNFEDSFAEAMKEFETKQAKLLEKQQRKRQNDEKKAKRAEKAESNRSDWRFQRRKAIATAGELLRAIDRVAELRRAGNVPRHKQSIDLTKQVMAVMEDWR